MLYALLLLGTAAWALWESGADWWALATRLGLLLLIGWTRRAAAYRPYYLWRDWALD